MSTPGNPFADPQAVRQAAPGNPFLDTAPTTAAAPTAPQGGSNALDYVTEPLEGVGRALKGAFVDPVTSAVNDAKQGGMSPIPTIPRPIANMVTSLVGQLKEAHQAGVKAGEQGENWAGQILANWEKQPIIGDFVRKAEEAGPGHFKLKPQTLGATAEAATNFLLTKAAEKSPAAAAKVGEVAGDVAGAVKSTKAAYFPKAADVASVQPERIAEIRSVPDRMAAVQKLAVDTEKTAHDAAKAAYPDVKKPVIRLTEGDEIGKYDPAFKHTVKEVPFAEAQEQYADLGKQIADERRAVQRGATPRYDLADLTRRQRDLGNAMRTAAEADGKLPQFNAAQAKFRQYMNDFHNPNSPIKPLLDMTPDMTQKISNHLINPDKGARTLETLRRHGADVTGATKSLSKGTAPLRTDVTEAAKLRQAGGDASAYTQRRLREAEDQLQNHRMPSGTEAKVPKTNLQSRAPVSRLLDNVISPRARALKAVQKALSEKK